MTANARVLVIGLDSAEPTLLDRWCDDGALPVLASLRKHGISGNTSTPAGFGNSVFWASLFTGVNPAKHGHYFHHQTYPGSYRSRFFHEDVDYRRQPFWCAASRNGRRVAVIDMVRGPLTPGINGVQLADWLAHDQMGQPRSSPDDLITTVIGHYGDDPIGGNADEAFGEATDKTELCERLLQRVTVKADLSVDYLKKGPWDLFMTVFADPHDVGHQCWHIHDPTHPMHDPALAGRIGDPIKAVYVAIDAAIGRLADAVGPDAIVMVVAGPGMGPNYTANHLLEEILHRLEPRPPTVTDLMRSAYRRLLPTWAKKQIAPRAEVPVDALLSRDRGRRNCYPVINNDNAGAIRVNLVGREAAGRVRPGSDYEAYCDILTRRLLQLVNLGTGQPVVDEVVRIAHNFQGEHLDQLPDLVLIWNRDAPITAVGGPDIGVVRGRYAGVRTGDHTPRGAFYVSGPGMEPMHLADEASVMDIGMSICSWLGVTLADADGAPIPALCGEKVS